MMQSNQLTFQYHLRYFSILKYWQIQHPPEKSNSSSIKEAKFNNLSLSILISFLNPPLIWFIAILCDDSELLEIKSATVQPRLNPLRKAFIVNSPGLANRQFNFKSN